MYFPNEDPTLAEAEKLSAIHRYFNECLFRSNLAPCRISVASNGNAKWLGCFQADACIDTYSGETIDQIIIDTDYVAEQIATGDLRRLFSTIVHEMCHQATRHEKTQHGKLWRAEMTRVGLIPRKIGNAWRNATHDIDSVNGDFSIFYSIIDDVIKEDWLSFKVSEKPEKKPTNRRTLVCPECGTKVSVSKDSTSLLCDSGHEPIRMVEA